MVAVLVGEHVELDEAAVGSAELVFEHLVEECRYRGRSSRRRGSRRARPREPAPPQPVLTDPVKVISASSGRNFPPGRNPSSRSGSSRLATRAQSVVLVGVLAGLAVVVAPGVLRVTQPVEGE